MTNFLLPHLTFSETPYWEKTNKVDNRLTATHPILTEARQISANQLLLTYDQPTDLASATKITNYWIRSNMEDRTDISSVGMGDALTMANTIRSDKGTIMPIDQAKTKFMMNFRVNAVTGVVYIVLPCFVSLEGQSGYTGANWGPFSRNMFIGI